MADPTKTDPQVSQPKEKFIQTPAERKAPPITLPSPSNENEKVDETITAVNPGDSSLNLSPPPSNKAKTIGVISLVFLLLALPVGIFISQQRQETRSSATSIESKPSPVAKNILTCLENNKDSQGVYAVGQNCLDGVCQKTSSSNHAGIYTAWAWFKLGGLEQIAASSQDLDTYLNVGKVPIIMADVPTCRFLKEIVQTDNSSLQTKAQLLCQKIRPGESASLDQAEKAVESNSLQEPSWQKLMTNPPTIENEGESISRLASAASDLASRYVLEQSVKELQISKSLYAQAVAVYQNQTPTLKEKALLGLAALDLHKATNNQLFLDQASLFWQAINTNNLCWANASPTNCRYLLKDAAFVALFARDLAKATQNNSYNETKRTILANLTSLTLDADGCLYSNFSAGKSKGTIENAIIAGLLAE